MTGIPDLATTLSVSKLDSALKERKSLAKTKRQTPRRKTKRSPYSESVAKASVNISGRITLGGPDGHTERDSPGGNKPESPLGQLGNLRGRASEVKVLDPEATEASDSFRISSTAAKLSPRSKRIKEKCHEEDVGKGEAGKETLRSESAPQVGRLHRDTENTVNDDIGDHLTTALESERATSKSDVTFRPPSASRLSQSKGNSRTKNTRPSSGLDSSNFRRTAPWPPSALKAPGIPDTENEASESKIRQIWRKELGLDVRPPQHKKFGPKEYITGLVIGYPGQKVTQPHQKTVTTTVVPTAKLSVSEIQKRRKVLPPIDSKGSAKTSKEDTNKKPPPQNRVKDINALAADLCRGAVLEIGNSEAEAVYRMYREWRKNAYYFDVPSNVGSARSKYHRPCHAPPNSDDEDGQDVQEVWHDSSYTRIVRIVSPDNDGETVITHTVDASKVFDFGGRVVRKTQIDVFLPSELATDEIHSGNGDDEGDNEDVGAVDEQNNSCHHGNNRKDCGICKCVLRAKFESKEQVGKGRNGEKEKLKQKNEKKQYAAYEEDDEEDSDGDDSEECSGSDYDEEDEDEDV